jgi:hypothetical protein
MGDSVNGKKATLLFLSTCLILAILMLTHVSTFIVVIIFAVALLAFGVPSHGFRRTW